MAENIRDRKQELRERIWSRLQEEGAARFPGAVGRIPNFTGAEDAARRLAGTPAWRQAEQLKANPDSPQFPVRKAALEAGKTVFMAVPRLREARPFLALDPEALAVPPHRAASIKGAARHGRPTHLDEMPHIDLVVAGSVAVSRDGARLGKGGGYSDLEFALAAEADIVSERTLVVTTVHPVQIVEAGTIPMTGHDVPLDFIVTAEEIIETSRAHARPLRILWDELDEEKLDAIPVLRKLKERRLDGQ